MREIRDDSPADFDLSGKYHQKNNFSTSCWRKDSRTVYHLPKGILIQSNRQNGTGKSERWHNEKRTNTLRTNESGGNRLSIFQIKNGESLYAESILHFWLVNVYPKALSSVFPAVLRQNVECCR